ncbi:MEMO1 family protein [Paragonimus westermani]|uniref:MEMO1 family protein n=1 Tax=Paragonimus westermani TaxID=34504 RepID=A0A5J4NHH1_9TREM|nr:MEMO1 family protein [Paragonimus westermani]
MTVRASSHAGLWYSDNASVLSSQLVSWLDNVNEDFKPARAIIVPRRIFILGPSHYANIGSKCALSPANVCCTPLGDIKIDKAIYEELQKTGEFVTFTKAQDEAEHSIEMQLPYIVQIAGNNPVSIVPIVVGCLSPERETVYGRLLAPFLCDPTTAVVISSDFCHWGSRFGYQYYLEDDGEIWQSVEKLDRMLQLYAKLVAIFPHRSAEAIKKRLQHLSRTAAQQLSAEDCSCTTSLVPTTHDLNPSTLTVTIPTHTPPSPHLNHSTSDIHNDDQQTASPSTLPVVVRTHSTSHSPFIINPPPFERNTHSPTIRSATDTAPFPTESIFSSVNNATHSALERSPACHRTAASRTSSTKPFRKIRAADKEPKSSQRTLTSI